MTTSFRPDWTSPPGDTMLDLIHQKGWSTDDFAQRLESTDYRVDELLEGRIAITIRTAKKLAEVLGASAEFWMARDALFRQSAERLENEAHQWKAQLPVSDMIRFGWLNPIPHPSEELASCLRFFGVSSVNAWREVYGELQDQVCFRTSSTYDSRPASVLAWLRQGEIEAASIQCEAWSRERFEAAVLSARLLTVEKDPQRFIPKLQQICSSAGVVVAVVRSPTGCRASGAARFVSKQKAILQLSFRHLSDDHFWFTFFHEAAHLLLHPIEEVFIDGLSASQEAMEKEANDYAARVLVPSDHLKDMFMASSDRRSIVRFARKLGISPGIVVGQLQHHRVIRMNQFNDLKRRFQWQLI